MTRPRRERRGNPGAHAFTASLRLPDEARDCAVAFEELGPGEQGTLRRDNNMRATVVHVVADAAVLVLVIVGLLPGRHLGWSWMAPPDAIVGPLAFANWAYTLFRHAGGILREMRPIRDPPVVSGASSRGTETA